MKVRIFTLFLSLSCIACNFDKVVLEEENISKKENLPIKINRNYFLQYWQNFVTYSNFEFAKGKNFNQIKCDTLISFNQIPKSNDTTDYCDMCKEFAEYLNIYFGEKSEVYSIEILQANNHPCKRELLMLILINSRDEFGIVRFTEIIYKANYFVSVDISEIEFNNLQKQAYSSQMVLSKDEFISPERLYFISINSSGYRFQSFSYFKYNLCRLMVEQTRSVRVYNLDKF